MSEKCVQNLSFLQLGLFSEQVGMKMLLACQLKKKTDRLRIFTDDYQRVQNYWLELTIIYDKE